MRKYAEGEKRIQVEEVLKTYVSRKWDDAKIAVK
jgi:hypothetical protein